MKSRHRLFKALAILWGVSLTVLLLLAVIIWNSTLVMEWVVLKLEGRLEPRSPLTWLLVERLGQKRAQEGGRDSGQISTLHLTVVRFDMHLSSTRDLYQELDEMPEAKTRRPVLVMLAEYANGTGHNQKAVDYLRLAKSIPNDVIPALDYPDSRIDRELRYILEHDSSVK